MAIPWQTDTASCRSGYQKTYDPYVPTFWPARVPNQVLTRENYEIVMDPHAKPEERLAAFANRAAWIRPLGSTSYTDQINNMIRDYGAMGVVEERPGPGGDFPAEMQVENLPSHVRRLLMALPSASPHDADRLDLTGIDKVPLPARVKTAELSNLLPWLWSSTFPRRNRECRSASMIGATMPVESVSGAGQETAALAHCWVASRTSLDWRRRSWRRPV